MHSNTRQVLGKSRQAHQRTIMHSNTRQALNASTRSVYAKWYWVNHGRLTSEQSCTRTLDRQRRIMHSNTRQALNASTRSVYAKWYWVNHGRLTSERQAHQRTQSLPSATHRHSSITRPCCSSAQAPSFLSFTRAHQRTIMDSNTRQAANNHALEHSTGSERVDAFGLREMVLGKSRQAHQRMQSLPSATHRHSSITRPCCSSAQALKRQASFTRRRVDAFATLRRDNHMHDHSRFQRDIDWRHRRLSLSLYYSQKSLTHNIGNASAFPIIKDKQSLMLIKFSLAGQSSHNFLSLSTSAIKHHIFKKTKIVPGAEGEKNIHRWR